MKPVNQVIEVPGHGDRAKSRLAEDQPEPMRQGKQIRALGRARFATDFFSHVTSGNFSLGI